MKDFFIHLKASYRSGWYFFYAFMLGYCVYAFTMGQWQLLFLLVPALSLSLTADYLFYKEKKKQVK